ncbi:MAG: hypothetical protein N2511_07605, partial [Thermodesulfovibrionales bacterium]|nr:hypothetical protein [Thermodesulfovibrionales bacterium]
DKAVETVIDFMNSNQKVGICGGQLLDLDGKKQNSIAYTPTLVTELFNKSLLRKFLPKKYPGKEHNISKPLEVESLVGAFLVIKKEAIDDVGLMDESFFFFFEETDWCLKMRKKGWLIFFHPDAKVYHLQGQTAKKFQINARIEYWRSRYIFFKKHYGAKILVPLMIGLLLKLALSLILNLLFCFLTAFLYKKAVERSKLYFAILIWHCLGFPPEYGLNNLSIREMKK